MIEMNIRSDLENIISLKKLKKDGSLDTEEYLESQEFKWRNSLDYNLLKYNLTCESEELRLHTLQLLAISKKSTLNFTEKELNLIITFLKCNLRDKIEYVPLIKKVLRRLNDSYAVLKRNLDKENKLKELQKDHPELLIPDTNLPNIIQVYETFIHSLHEICLNNLYPGAVNVRKKSSLQILCLMDEFLSEDLKCSLWTIDQLNEIFNCLLLDTYEVNKEIAFNLIKSCKLLEKFFDTKDKVLELVDVAVQMSNSIRPLDSITAAYMLRIAILLPNVQDVLIKLTEFNTTEFIEEKTTFYMILLLKIYLEKPVKLATNNIVFASSRHSLYGYLFCIHSILSTVNLRVIVNDTYWRDVISDLISMCFELNLAVSQIVNNSSPEGHLPMDLNPQHLEYLSQSIEEVVITPQMVLLCSWRTVKEISLLFGYLTSNASIFNDETKTGLLTEHQIEEIGNVLVTLLCETKHRGAFEQAHVGFGQLCNRLWHLEHEHSSLKQLPKIWLQQLLLAVIGLSLENSKLCATRRSAGVPFMVQALVTSEIKKRCDTKILIFHSVMRILLKLTNVENEFTLSDIKNILLHEPLFKDYKNRQYINDLDRIEKEKVILNESTEIKTHSLNILRALYRHCLLGDLVKDYIAQGFVTAFKSYDGKSWAERNAATLLFSSLVVRVFGVQRTKDHVNLTLHNKMTGRNFFEKFPSLLPFLLKELTVFVNEPEIQIKPKIQSILLILSRLYPSVISEASDNEWKIDQFINLVSQCGKSRVYKIRELAARALVPLLTEKNVLPISCNLLNLITTRGLSFNLLHGCALQFLEIVKNQQFTKIELPMTLLQNFLTFLSSNILNNLESVNNSPACYTVSTVAIEILIELFKMHLYSWIYEDSTFLKLRDIVQSHLTNNALLKKRPGIELYQSMGVHLLFIVLNNAHNTPRILNNKYEIIQFWENILTHKNTEVSSFIWSKFITIIKKLNCSNLYKLAFNIAIQTLYQPMQDSDLQHVIFEFIYYSIQEMQKNVKYIECIFPNENEKNNICTALSIQLVQLLKSTTVYLRGEYFKLLGKAFGHALQNCTPQTLQISNSNKEIIYDTFLDYSSMESNLDCRIAISEVIFDLYTDEVNDNNIYLILNWWTTLLQLLYDDNYQVRSNAGQVVCELLKESVLPCESIIIDKFFTEFVSKIGKNVEVLVGAFFCWSMTSAAVVLEEMDETDVFNKSCNYECFEPLQITKKCIFHLKPVISQHSLNPSSLPKSVKKWLIKQLELDESFEFDSLITLIANYQDKIPCTEKSLKRILDPIYSAKLIKEIAYLEFKNTVIVGN